jgi:hypothetical protein
MARRVGITLLLMANALAGLAEESRDQPRAFDEFPPLGEVGGMGLRY